MWFLGARTPKCNFSLPDSRIYFFEIFFLLSGSKLWNSTFVPVLFWNSNLFFISSPLLPNHLPKRLILPWSLRWPADRQDLVTQLLSASLFCWLLLFLLETVPALEDCRSGLGADLYWFKKIGTLELIQ